MEIRRFPSSSDEGWSLRRTPGNGARYGEQGAAEPVMQAVEELTPVF